jgi:hypothetical protein
MFAATANVVLLPVPLMASMVLPLVVSSVVLQSTVRAALQPPSSRAFVWMHELPLVVSLGPTPTIL